MCKPASTAIIMVAFSLTFSRSDSIAIENSGAASGGTDNATPSIPIRGSTIVTIGEGMDGISTGRGRRLTEAALTDEWRILRGKDVFRGCPNGMNPSSVLDAKNYAASHGYYGFGHDTLRGVWCLKAGSTAKLLANVVDAPEVNLYIRWDHVCKSNCNSCTDETTCTQCKDSKYLHNNDCVTACPAGTFGSGSGATGRICQACESSCNRCTDATTCTQCTNSNYLRDGNCLTTCPVGTFGSGSGTTGRICQACETDCSKCADASTCTQCKDYKYLYHGNCVTMCPAGYHGSGEEYYDRSCQSCESNCNSCTDATTCTQCKNSKYLLNNDCVTICPTGTVGSGSGATGRICEGIANCGDYMGCNEIRVVKKGNSVKCSGDAATCDMNTCCETSPTGITGISPTSITAGVATSITLTGTVATGDLVTWATSCSGAVPNISVADGKIAATFFPENDAGMYKLCYRANALSDSVEQTGITLNVQAPAPQSSPGSIAIIAAIVIAMIVIASIISCAKCRKPITPSGSSTPFVGREGGSFTQLAEGASFNSTDPSREAIIAKMRAAVK